MPRLCRDCDRRVAIVKGEPRARCHAHLAAERVRCEKVRRARGQVPMAEYLLDVNRNYGRVLTRVVLDAKIKIDGRCSCGLLLPCYHPGIEAYASARPGGGDS